MKRFLYLITFLMVTTLANATLWTAPNARDYTSSTPVYLQVNVNGELLTQYDQWFMRYNDAFTIAAFIDGECRGTVNSPDASDIYYLRVWGDATKDQGKTITLKILYGGLVFDMKKTYTFDSESHGVDKLNIDYPTGVTTTTANISAEFPTQYDLASHISFEYKKSDESLNKTQANEATIEDLNLTWFLGNYVNEFEIEDNSTMLTVTKDAYENSYQIYLTYLGPDDEANYGKRFRLDTSMTVEVSIAKILVTSLTYTGSNIVCTIGDNVFRMIQPNITVAPDNASNKEFTLTPDAAATAAGAFSRTGEALLGGEWNVIATANDGSGVTCTIPVKVSTPVSFAFPRAINLSKYSDATCTLTNLSGDGFDASKIAVVFVDESGSEFPAATAKKASQDGMKWTFRANYVSDAKYKFYFTYDGKPMKNTKGEDYGDILCPVEIKMPESGWDWIMVPAAFTISENGVYNTDLFNYNANNRVLDMRSETGLVYYDTTYGLFGDITSMTPADGMYKVKANFADYSVLDLSVFGLYEWDEGAVSVAKKVKKGYNWVAYPKEYNSSIADWNANDDIEISNEGDVIIGKTGFAEFDGKQWVASNDFVLEAGKGYIYYTESENSFVPTLGAVSAPQQAPAKMRAKAVRYWEHNHTQFADNMAVVAQIEGIENAEQFSIGAFVGDECRGEGSVNESGKFFINVAGKHGEKVNFRILNTATGETIGINEAISHSAKLGSLLNPVAMSVGGDITGINVVRINQNSGTIYDLQGRKVNANGVNRGLYIVNGKTVVIK